MAKTSNIFARVEPAVKEQAEDILAQLGVSMSNAINMFLRQGECKLLFSGVTAKQ